MNRAPLLLSTSFLAAALLLVAAEHLQPIGLATDGGGEHCSAVVLDNGGHGLFGANYDHNVTDEGLIFINKRGTTKSSLFTGTTGRRAHWIAQYASVTFNLVGYEYAWAGMNERGLSLSTMSLDETRTPASDRRPPLDSGEWMQFILDTCESIDEVLAADDDVRIFTVDHYLVGDRFGNAAVIEFLNGRMVAHAAPNLPVAVLTNSTYEDSCATWESRRALADYAGLDGSLFRFCLAADRVASFGAASDARAVRYAFDTLYEVRGQRFGNTPSQWSIVFDARNLRAYYRTQRNPIIRWIDLDDFDLRCGKPVQMLGIHETGGGDLAAEFYDFDFDRNCEHFENFLTIWGIEHTQQAVMATLDHFESFQCVQSRRLNPRQVTSQ